MHHNFALLAVLALIAMMMLTLLRKPKHPRVFTFTFTYRVMNEFRSGSQYIIALDLHQARQKAMQILSGVHAIAGDHHLYEDDRLVATLPVIFD